MKTSISDIPVLFIIFRRPDVTRQVFDVIRKVRPKRLFVCADGPRDHVKGEAELCRQTREIIKTVDWDCQVESRYNNVNQGCRITVSSAIQWFFDQVESGIILEDDVLPSQSFFWFCQEMLERYKDDERVMQISGANYVAPAHASDTYHFSRFNDVSGWATWRRAWKFYDMKMSLYDEFKRQGRIHDYFDDPRQAEWLMSYFEEAVALDKCGVWSTQWSFAMTINNALTIFPNMPLTTHIGFNEEGTNYQKALRFYPKIQVQEIQDIRHPDFIMPHKAMDALKFALIRKTDPHVHFNYRLRRTAKNFLKKHLSSENYEKFMKFSREVRRCQ